MAAFECPLILGFSKPENLAAACALHVAYFCWRMRENGKSGKRRPTPCEMAGVTREALTVDDLYRAIA